MKTIITEMLQALNANIEYLRESGGSETRVKFGSYLYNVGEKYVYEFELPLTHTLSADNNEDIDIKTSRYPRGISAKVESIDEGKITVSCENDLGEKINEAKLVVSNYKLLELLVKKLTEVSEGSATLSDLNQKVFGLKESITVGQKKVAVITGKSNASQQLAINKSLNSEVTYIWGPPGTGKTSTIASIVENYIINGKSVLLIAHTNAATDQVLFDVLKHLKNSSSHSDAYQDGKILRIGTPTKKELIQDFPIVQKDQAVEIKSKGLTLDLEKLRLQFNPLSEEINKLKSTVDLIDKLSDLESKKIEIEAQLHKQINQKTANIESINEIKKKIEQIEADIERYYLSNTIQRLIFGLNKDKLLKLKTNLYQEQNSLENWVNNLEGKVSENNLQLKSISGEIKSITLEVGEKNKDTILLRMSIVNKKMEPIKQRIDDTEKKIKEIMETVILDASVIATTLTKSYSDQLILSRTYDYVIIDEVSMAPLPAVWYASGLAREGVVLVGDFLQLPPVVKHRAPEKSLKSAEVLAYEATLIDKWMKRDVFEFSQVKSRIQNGENVENLVQLDMQYRMVPPIGDMVNYLIYAPFSKEFALLNGVEKIDKVPNLDSLPLAASHIGVYDTGSVGSISLRSESGSYYNFYHALVALELAKQALDSGYEEIGIISPFRAQVDLVQRMLKDRGLDKKVEADTVHRFQGGAKDLVIFDLSTPNPTHITDDKGLGGDDEKLFNVAISRSKEKFIIIADVGAVLKKHSSSSIFRNALEYIEMHNYPINSCSDLINEAIVTKETEESLSKLVSGKALQKQTKNSELMDERDFYKLFVRDLAAANLRVIINSPFITSRRTRDLISIFKILRDRGVDIYIITRAVEDHEGYMRSDAIKEISELEKIGVKVIALTGKVHEKFAIIDDLITYEGSLNILSQRESSESMRKFIGTESAKQLLKFYGLDKNLKTLIRCDCGGWFWQRKGRFGAYSSCTVCGTKPGMPPRKSAEIKEKKIVNKAKKENKPTRLNENGIPICSNCNLGMNSKKGRFGEYWECGKCRVTISAKKASALNSK